MRSPFPNTGIAAYIRTGIKYIAQNYKPIA